MKKILALLLMLCCGAFAQNFVTVSGANVQGSDGTKLASGLACFRVTDASGNPVSVRAGGNGQTVSLPVCATVTTGVFSTPLVNVDLASPANQCINAYIYDNASKLYVIGNIKPENSRGFNCLQTKASNAWCSAGVCDFDSYPPSTAALGQLDSGVSSINNLAVNGTLAVTSSIAGASISVGGDTAMTANPSMLWTGYMDGGSNIINTQFDKGITVIRINFEIGTAPLGCSAGGQVILSETSGSSPNSYLITTLTNSQTSYSSGLVSYAIRGSRNARFAIGFGTGCSTPPGKISFTMVYKMK